MKAASAVWSHAMSSAVLALMAIAVAGCSGSGTTSGAGPTTTSAFGSTTSTVSGAGVGPGTSVSTPGTSSRAPASGPATSSVPETATTVAAAIANPTSGVEFRSPSGNIHCEIDNGSPYPDHRAFCFSAQPAQSATMASDGTYRTCAGLACLANPAMNEVVLPYGQKVALGPFVCSSSTTAMTCTAESRGFEISRSGIVSI